MAIRVAIIGYGAVAAIHARRMASEGDVSLITVFGPNREKSQAFAAEHGVERVAETLGEAVSAAEVAFICSPTGLHYEQAKESIRRGVHTLVEFPPCEKGEEAEDLQECAQDAGLRIGCAHTSRFLVTYQQIRATMQAGELGEILAVNYVRHHCLNARSWTDNAFFHHAAHPIDLAIAWFGGIVPTGCVALPAVSNSHTVSLLGKLPHGGPMAISVTYLSKLPHLRMHVVGREHTIETDGFTYVRSDLKSLSFQSTYDQTYEAAIHDQDMAFISTCQGEDRFPPWSETVTLMHAVDGFRILSSVQEAGNPHERQPNSSRKA